MKVLFFSLAERLSKYPHLRHRMESILGIIENDDGSCQTADEKGVLIGQIHLTQNLLKQERTPQEELIRKRKEELQSLLQQLQSQLNRS